MVLACPTPEQYVGRVLLDPPDKIADVTPEISIVVPLRDEDTNVMPLHRELSSVLQAHHLSYEIILIDDGSEDSDVREAVGDSRAAT